MKKHLDLSIAYIHAMQNKVNNSNESREQETAIKISKMDISTFLKEKAKSNKVIYEMDKKLLKSKIYFLFVFLFNGQKQNNQCYNLSIHTSRQLPTINLDLSRSFKLLNIFIGYTILIIQHLMVGNIFVWPNKSNFSIDIHSLCFGCNFHRIITIVIIVPFDKIIRLWDIETIKQFICFQNKNSMRNVKYYVMNGNIICFKSVDKTVLLWDARSKKQTRIFNGHIDYVTFVDHSSFVSNGNNEIEIDRSHIICPGSQFVFGMFRSISNYI
ncbi:hypothetical protein RFI_22448 [Reticulomyxa filosa]|uniref:Uncharacterized protein n=1 Tax=Reticulomyxa filosa TaxID=46433 RepID=X6MPD2_RETFI|nr:hypothetical protein RFI_22448 [Reticulomyxa filosa]|eukprot:ETO14915.1 hypothetical protein RFI_22448 [Reticulomyxa filosa]